MAKKKITKWEPENKLIDQDSLQLLFNTKEIISYELLCEKLEQKPKLSYVESVYYLTPTQDNRDAQGHLINGGTYNAEFTFEDLIADIMFVKQNDDYIALSIRLKSQNETK